MRGMGRNQKKNERDGTKKIQKGWYEKSERDGTGQKMRRTDDKKNKMDETKTKKRDGRNRKKNKNKTNADGTEVTERVKTQEGRDEPSLDE